MTHVPVLLPEIIKAISPRVTGKHSVGRIVDACFGGGGYSKRFLDAFPQAHVHGIDADPNDPIMHAKRLKDQYGSRFNMHHGYFGDVLTRALEPTKDTTPRPSLLQVPALPTLLEPPPAPFDTVIFDLGISSIQIGDPSRGFAFSPSLSGPLDCRFDAGVANPRSPSASELLLTLPANDLTAMLAVTMGTTRARKVTSEVILRRPRWAAAEPQPPAAAAGAAAAATPLPHGATAQIQASSFASAVRYAAGPDDVQRAFLALRLAVNDELGDVHRGVSAALRATRRGGSVVVVVYHSAEATIVEDIIGAAGWGRDQDGLWRALARRPRRRPPAGVDGVMVSGVTEIHPTDAEVSANARARSAVLYDIAL